MEVGEIDTKTPFQSVKDAVNLFGEDAFLNKKITIKNIKPPSTEKLHSAQKEVCKLKERLKIAEITKIDALNELEHAKKTVDDLTKKLEIINKAKEAAKNRYESRKTNLNGGLNQDLDNTKQQYADVFTELDTAKQELIRICHDHESAIEEQKDAIKQETESTIIKTVNLDRTGEISKEIMYVQEKEFAEKNVQKLANKAAVEESAKKLLALQKRVDPETFKGPAETTCEMKRVETEMEYVRVSDLDSLKSVTFGLDGAKNLLQKVVEEESLLKKLLECLKIEFKNVKNEHEELKQKEAETESERGRS